MHNYAYACQNSERCEKVGAFYVYGCVSQLRLAF